MVRDCFVTECANRVVRCIDVYVINSGKMQSTFIASLNLFLHVVACVLIEQLPINLKPLCDQRPQFYT